VRSILVLVAAAACGRIGFEATSGRGGDDAATDGGATDDAAGDGPQAMPGPGLACSETVTASAARIGGVALEAVVTPRGLAAFWIGVGGALFATTWTAASGTPTVVQDGAMLAPGPFTQLWATANGDEILVATLGAEMTVHFFHGDLTASHADISLGMSALGGREPFTRKRGGTGFVVISSAGDQPGVFELPPPNPGVAHLLTELRFHAAPSIAADTDGYAVVTELADQFGPGCWYSKVSDAFGVAAGPGTLETTQQADCDSSTVAASTGAAGAAMAWMDRDPANSYATFRATAGGSGTASMANEVGVGLPIVTATSTGVAALYRSSAGVRVFDAAGARTLAPSTALADLVTWDDRALVVWTTAAGAVQLTRLCPAVSPRAP
jgi:hypothetical protein